MAPSLPFVPGLSRTPRHLLSATLAATAALLPGLFSGSLHGQQPHGIHEALEHLSSQHATHSAVTFDRDMLAQADRYLNADGTPNHAVLNSITFESFRFEEPAFYTPEGMHELVHRYEHAGWKHLVDRHASPGESASPEHPLTDLWFHFHGAEIDDVTVLIRAPRQMNLIEVSGTLRPLDLIHLGGHFGIPKVDPDAVMVPAPPGR